VPVAEGLKIASGAHAENCHAGAPNPNRIQ
jgi:hypothetical protein